MIIILPESQGDLVCLKVSGKLTDADYKGMIPKLEAVIDAHGKIRLFADLSEFNGWEWIAAWDDFAFGIKHWNHISRMALVGEKRWQELSATIADKIMPADVKFFAVENSNEAFEWVRK